MPLPIVPAPMTPTVLICIMRQHFTRRASTEAHGRSSSAAELHPLELRSSPSLVRASLSLLDKFNRHRHAVAAAEAQRGDAALLAAGASARRAASSARARRWRRSGWPSATAPPWTLTRAGSRPSSRVTATACTANASFSSTRSASSIVQPVFSSSFLHRFDRRHHHELRLEARRSRSRRRARSASGSSRAATSAPITTSAAAPSLTPGALPAVTVPSFLNAGFSRPSDSTVVSSRIDSSRSIDDRVALLLRNRHRQDLVLEPALLASRARPCGGCRRRTDPAPRA